MSVREKSERKKPCYAYRADKKSSDEHGDLHSMKHRSASCIKPLIVVKIHNTPFNNRERFFESI